MIIGGSLQIGQLPYTIGGYLGGSLSFNGSTQYLTVPTSAAFSFDANFTIEFWAYIISAPGSYIDLVGTANEGTFLGAGNSGWVVAYYTTGNAIRFSYQSSSVWTYDAALGLSVTLNTWQHIAVVRNGTTITGYLNGVAGGTPITGAGTTLTSNLYGPYIGAGAGFQGGKLNGYISNVRIVKGTAVYTSNFSVPTAPLTNITNTSLLLSVSSPATYITDSSSSPLTVTNVNTTTYNSLTPFQVPTIMSIGSTPPPPPTVEYLVVAGGGGGGGDGNTTGGGGGGAGGLLTATSFSIISGANIIINVGAGGAGGPNFNTGNGSTGSNSTIIGSSIVVAVGGGGGSGIQNSGSNVVRNGGSGGGANYLSTAGTGTAGQGNDGGAVTTGAGNGAGGGGGGKNAVGGTGTPAVSGGAGGAGTFTTLISTTTAVSLGVGQYVTATNAVYFAGGGGGGGDTSIGIPGLGGAGGGGRGGATFLSAGNAGTPNTGGGGGGGTSKAGNVSGAGGVGGAGGSGIVILRYPDSYATAVATAGSGITVLNTSGYITYIFTSSGSITF